MVFDADAPDDGVTQGRILAELEAVFQTVEFERAPVMRRLLAFLVRTTLAGGGDELKAYSVAVDGLGRDPDFDSQSDSYPRVQVGRLRKMLDVYYAQWPSTDDVRLFIKPGGYRVHFRKTSIAANPAGAEAPAPPIPLPPAMIRMTGPFWSWITRRSLMIAGGLFVAGLIAVLAWILISNPFQAERRAMEQAPTLEIRTVAAVGDEQSAEMAKRVSAFLGYALHRSWIVRVATPGSKGPALSEARSPDYILTGQVNSIPGGTGPRVYLTLVDSVEGTQVWTESLELPPETPLYTTLRPVVANLIGTFGVIATDQRNKLPQGITTGYGCLLNFERYFRDRQPALKDDVRACVTDTVQREPMNATALAAASYLEFDWMMGGGTQAAHTRGADLARRAVVANPYSADAQVADARAAFIAGQCRRGKEISERAISLNPYDPGLLGLLGFLLYQCDDPQAVELLTTARTLDPDLPPFYSVALILGLIESGDTEQAIRVADTIRPPTTGMAAQYLLAQSIALAANGDLPGARREWSKIQNIRKVSGNDPDLILSQYLFSPPFRAKVIRHLRSAGIIPPDKKAAEHPPEGPARSAFGASF